MISARIKAIASFINQEDFVVDIGCDHGYLCVYLKENNLCQNVIASDIKESALNMARENFQKRNLKIATYLSDGFKNIKDYYNTAVIAGMGTTTILNILTSDKKPNKLVIASNNELAKLRFNLNKIGYKIVKEKAIYDKGHYYVIMLCYLGKQKLKKKEILFGISNNKEYYNYLIKKNNAIITKVPLIKKLKLYYQNYILKGLTEKK